MLKWVGKTLWRHRMSAASQVPLPNIYESRWWFYWTSTLSLAHFPPGGRSNPLFLVRVGLSNLLLIGYEQRKTGTSEWRSVADATLACPKSYWQHVPPDMIKWEGHFSFVMLFPQIYNISPIMRKHQINPGPETSCKIPDHCSSKYQGGKQEKPERGEN